MNNPEAIQSIWKDVQRLQANVTHFQMGPEHHRTQYPWGWVGVLDLPYATQTYFHTRDPTSSDICSDYEKDGQPFSPSVGCFLHEGNKGICSPNENKRSGGHGCSPASSKDEAETEKHTGGNQKAAVEWGALFTIVL